LTKGTQITVSGYLKQDRWEKDGQKQSRVQVVADMVQVPNVSKKDADKVAEAFGGEAFPEDNPFGN
jgi:single-strand DNA-binding protein